MKPNFRLVYLTAEHVDFLLRWSEKRLVPGTGGLLRQYVNFEPVVTAVAEADGKLIGVSTTVYDAGDAPDWVIRSSVTVVHPDWRSRHVGRKLLEMKTRELALRGVVLTSVVGRSNEASMKMTGSVLREVGDATPGPRGARARFEAEIPA